MSDQIEDLIASISEKFDSEFQTQEDTTKSDENLLFIKSIHKNAEQGHEPNPEQSNTETVQREERPAVFIQEQKQYQADEGQGKEIEEEDNNEGINREQTIQNGDSEIGEQEEQQGHQQEEENRYKDLSKKLETALKKISSSKRGFYHSESLNQSHCSGNVLLRFDEYQKKKERELHSKRQQEEEKRLQKLKDRPSINQKSRQLVQELSQKPIYERFQKIVEDKKKKLAENQEIKKQREEQEFEEYMDQFNKHQKKSSGGRDSATYFQDMVSWKEKIEQRKQEERERNEKKAVENLTFTPSINQKSARMIKNQKRVPIQNRDIERPRVQEPEGCTFHPKINKRIIK